MLKDEDWANLALAYLRVCAMSAANEDEDMLKRTWQDLRELPSGQEGELLVSLMRFDTLNSANNLTIDQHMNIQHL
jgi:hypothetical protein